MHLTKTLSVLKYNKQYHPHHIDRLLALQGKPLASFWRRALAFIIDILISIVILYVGILIYALIAGKFVNDVKGNPHYTYKIEGETGKLIMEVLLPITYFGLIVFFTQGKTVGKWITGIRIVPITHERISFIHSAERAMAYATSVLEFGFGFAQFFMNVNHRTLGDKVGETIVIRDRMTKKEKRALKQDDSVNLEGLIEAETEIP